MSPMGPRMSAFKPCAHQTAATARELCLKFLAIIKKPAVLQKQLWVIPAAQSADHVNLAAGFINSGLTESALARQLPLLV